MGGLKRESVKENNPIGVPKKEKSTYFAYANFQNSSSAPPYPKKAYLYFLYFNSRELGLGFVLTLTVPTVNPSLHEIHASVNLSLYTLMASLQNCWLVKMSTYEPLARHYYYTALVEYKLFAYVVKRLFS
jgi:hypothetical protein